ncbi:MAG: sigma-70 family RNA polymerase sigma factor [Acidobacteriota bacterium]
MRQLGSGSRRFASVELTDDDLLEAFRRHDPRSWNLFLTRYAGRIIGQLRALGLDRDDAMDCFVFVCERLAEDQFRRLRQVRATGQRGELVPWLRRVVKHSAIDWGWTRHGRRRLFRSVSELSELDQRVFQLHFWAGLGPASMLETLRTEGRHELGIEQIFEALERVLECLDAGQRWRLLSQLAGRRSMSRLGDEGSGLTPGWEPTSAEPDPEQRVLGAEQHRLLERALGELPSRERLILRLRYDDGLSLPEIAKLIGLGLTTVKAALRKGRESLRATLEES